MGGAVMRARCESAMAARASLRHGAVILLACLLALAAGSACRRAAPAAGAAETPTFDVTSWTDKTELFMEYPPLVAGETARFAVHLTRLADFSALDAGRPHIELTPEAGGAPVTIPGTEPLRPGAFRVEGRMPAAGAYRWALVVDAPGLSDRHDLGTVTVFADAARGVAAAGAQPAEDPAAIAYLKEQQWTNPFATARVQESDLRTALRVPAQIQPVTGGEAVVAAPAAGRFRADDLVSIGEMVRAGRVLGLLEPRLAEGDDRVTLAAAVAETRSRSTPRARNSRAPRRSWRKRPCPRGAWTTRAGPWRWRTHASGAPRPGSPSATRHCARAAAPPPRTRSRCARHGRPRDGSIRHAGRVLRGRRTAVSHRAHRRSGTAGAGTAGGRAPHGRCRRRGAGDARAATSRCR